MNGDSDLINVRFGARCGPQVDVAGSPSSSGNAGQPAKEDFKINGQYVNTPDQGVVGIPFFDTYVEKAALEYLDGCRCLFCEAWRPHRAGDD